MHNNLFVFLTHNIFTIIWVSLTSQNIWFTKKKVVKLIVTILTVRGACQTCFSRIFLIPTPKIKYMYKHEQHFSTSAQFEITYQVCILSNTPIFTMCITHKWKCALLPILTIISRKSCRGATTKASLWLVPWFSLLLLMFRSRRNMFNMCLVSNAIFHDEVLPPLENLLTRRNHFYDARNTK